MLKEQQTTQIYNKYKYLIIGALSIYSFFYFKHNFTKSEFSARKQPNILIPQFVYDIRRKHYIYWEMSRVARGYRKTFSYYNYDREAVSHHINKFYLFRNFCTLLTKKEIIS